VASTRKITFTDYNPIINERILLITNVTDGIIIYNFADPLKGGTCATNVLTLAYNTTTMSNTDKLQIFYDDADTAQLIDGTVFDGGNNLVLRELLESTNMPLYYDPATNSIKALVTGSVTATVASTTVTAYSGIPADPLIPSLLNLAWAQNIRSLLI
jgi:hypothetical protein